jgi:L-threonine kinase
MNSDVRDHQLWKEASEGDPKTGIGRCFGTFGELLQGVLPDQERQFLVTLPITRYSTARFTASSGSREVCVYPPHKDKSRRLADKLMHTLDLDSGGFLSIRSELPAGKGCASSSADMVATALAIQSAFGVSIFQASLAQVMSSIEPSDGVMYRGIVSFYHREGVLRKFLGCLPSLTIVGLDEGGQVDTVEFNERPKPFGRAHRAEYEDLLLGMERAVACGDLRTLGEISTRSAIMNQEILPKNHLDLLLDMRRRYEALGVVVAHSGTQLGLLLDPDSSNYSQSLPAIITELAQDCPDVCIHRTHDFRTLEPQHEMLPLSTVEHLADRVTF